MALLVALDEGIEGGAGGGDVAQAHAPADLGPEQEAGLALVRGHGPTRVHPAPAQRKLYEGPQHEQVVVVGDAVVRMRAVDAVERLRAHLAVPARLQKMADQQAGVVVALLAMLAELARAVQQGGDRVAAIGVEQRQLQRALHVPGHVVLAHQAHDALAIGTRIQRGDGARHLGIGEQAPALAKRFGHGDGSLTCVVPGSVAAAPAHVAPAPTTSGMPRGEKTPQAARSPAPGNTLISHSSSRPATGRPVAAQAYSRPRSRPAARPQMTAACHHPGAIRGIRPRPTNRCDGAKSNPSDVIQSRPSCAAASRPRPHTAARSTPLICLS